MEIFKTIIEIILSIIVTIMAVVLPVTIYNFKRENQIIKKKTKKGELIDLYGTFLMAPIISLLLQLGAMNEVIFLKPIFTFFSFIFPVEIILILGYKTLELYKQNNPNNIKMKGLAKIGSIIICITNFFIWISYSFIMMFIVYLLYNGIIKHSEYIREYLSLSITMYVFLLILYFLIGKLIIGTYKKEYATKIKINYNYKGKNIEKEIQFNYFKVKTEYVSFYIENDNKKYIIPWDKVNDVSVYYK